MISLNNSNNIIQLINVSKEYSFGSENVKVISNVNLSINKGEFIVIMGPSGSGKSTLLNLIAGFTCATKGDIYIKGNALANLTKKEMTLMRRFTIGYIFQFFNLHSFLTAAENIELPMLFANTPKAERRPRALKLLNLIDLKDKENSYPHELSGGQQQRIGISRAIANNPEIILADEPTGNLDSQLALEIIDILLNMHKQGKTIVLVSHNEHLLQEGMKIIKLRDGEILSIADNQI